MEAESSWMASTHSSWKQQFSKFFFLYVRAFQGLTGGNLIEPELMGHVANPYKSKEFLFHRGCSFDVTSILQIRTHRWRTQQQRRKTDLHHQRKWKNTQDAVNFDQFNPSTRQRITILADKVSCRNCIQLCAADCIYKK